MARPHRDEIRRHVDGGIERIRSVAARVKREAEAATRCWSWSRPWPARPTGWSSCAARPRRSTIPRNMTWSSQRRAGHRRPARDDPAEHGREGAQLHGLAAGPASGVHGNARVEAVEGATLDEALRAARSRSSPASRASATTAGWRRSAAADRTRRRSRSPPGSRPTAATSTPTSTASTPPTRASCPKARKLTRITFEEMLELAGVGAKVLQVRSVGLAMRENLPLRVLSAFEDKPGTEIVAELSGADMERNSHRRHRRRPQRGADHADRHRRPAGHGRGGDRPARRGRHPGRHDRPRGDAQRGSSDLTFTVPRASLAQAMAVIEQRKDAIGYAELLHRRCGRQGQHRRRRHPLQPAARGEDVRDAGRAQINLLAVSRARSRSAR
jgi:aspartate kinase